MTAPRSTSFARLVLLAFAWCVATAHAADPSLEVTANRERIYVGESFILQVKVGGADERTEPDLSQIRGCRVKALGSQDISNYSIVIINGRMQRQGFSGRVYVYELTPEAAGTFVAGPVSVRAGDKVFSADGPQVTVVGITRQETVKVGVAASRTAVLVDEPFDITLTVRIRRLAGRYADTEPLYPGNPPVLTIPYLDAPGIEGVKGPDIVPFLNAHLAGRGQPGMAINKFTVPDDPLGFGGFFGGAGVMGSRPATFTFEKRAVQENGTSYTEYRLTVPYSPLEEGNYTFGPVEFKGPVPVEVDERGQASGTDIFAVGPAVTVRVIPPPEADRPDSYIGALGSNLVVQAALDAQTCNVGDPLTLTLAIDGAVQMRNIFPPRLSLQTNLIGNFEVYDDSVKTLKRDTGRQYAYTLRPRKAGSMELPPLAVSYYDLAAREYRTVHTDPIPLKVRQAVEVTASQIIGNVTGPATRLTAPPPDVDLTPAAMRAGANGSRPIAVWGSTPRVLAILGAGPAVFILVWIASSALRRRERRCLLRRSRTALRRAVHTMRRPPAAGTSADQHARLCMSLRHFVGDRLGMAADALTPADAAALLRRQGASAENAQAFETVMGRHFNGAYGTGAAPTADEIAAACRLLENLDRELARPDRAESHPSALRALLPWIVAAGVLHAPSESHALTADEANFLWTEANTLLASAHERRDYAAAAQTYQRLIDAGVRNADVLYNQGTALLQAGRYEDAIRVLARAERYDGSQPDIARNLQIAKARKAGLKTRVTLWDRVLLFWHYRLPGATRVMLGAIGFMTLWLALAAFHLRRRSIGRGLMGIALVLLILFGSSALTTLLQEQTARRPVFTSAAP